MNSIIIVKFTKLSQVLKLGADVLAYFQLFVEYEDNGKEASFALKY